MVSLKRPCKFNFGAFQDVVDEKDVKDVSSLGLELAHGFTYQIRVVPDGTHQLVIKPVTVEEHFDDVDDALISPRSLTARSLLVYC